jgi:hypothetical protein
MSFWSPIGHWSVASSHLCSTRAHPEKHPETDMPSRCKKLISSPRTQLFVLSCPFISESRPTQPNTPGLFGNHRIRQATRLRGYRLSVSSAHFVVFCRDAPYGTKCANGFTLHQGNAYFLLCDDSKCSDGSANTLKQTSEGRFHVLYTIHLGVASAPCYAVAYRIYIEMQNRLKSGSFYINDTMLFARFPQRLFCGIGSAPSLRVASKPV